MSNKGSGWIVSIFTFAILSATAIAPAQEINQTQTEPQLGIVYFNTGSVAVSDLLNLLDDPAATFDPEQAYVLMLDGPITADRRSELEGMGVALYDYLPLHSYIARLGTVSADDLRATGYVRFVGMFRPEWKIDPELFSRVYTTPEMQAILNSDRLPTTVTIFAGADPTEALNALKNLDGAWIHRAEPLADWFEIVAEIPREKVDTIANLASVQYIEPAPEITLRNSSNRWIVQSNLLNVTPVYNAGIRGAGQIIGVLDGRADRQHCSLNGTKILFYNTSEGFDNQHGTHVSCTAAGNAGVNDNTRGVAYEANIAFNLTPSLTESGVNTALTTHSNQGARVHTNSWGNDGTTSYDGLARGFDVFAYAHEDDIVMLAATNLSSLKNPENAKNLVAVGASQDTPNQANHCSGGTGPTADSRRKPEVYAPGCSTTSATPGSCGTANLTGTSMASPAVAGAAALIRQYYTEGYYPTGVATAGNTFTPTGALLKATLINSSVDMTGIAGYPSNQEGWGRVLLDDALYFPGDARKLLVLDDKRNASGLSTGQTVDYTFDVASNAEQLRVTLVWTDPPASASTGTGNAAVNDLDLQVTSPTSTVYRGNVFSGGVSIPGGSKDPRNNVEQVHLNGPAVGQWTARVSAATVAQGLQGYALIVTGDVAETPLIVPPAAPTGVNAQDAASCAKIALSWTASDGADDYEVWRNTENNSGTAAIIANSLAGTTFDDVTAVYGTTYFYWVKACNTAGCSPFSMADSGELALIGDFTGDGIVDGADLQGFTDAHVQSPNYDDCADLAAPLGTLDDADIAAFVDLLIAP